jgi:flavin reductase (DIM6/NTAB) family NADH-FMN oxidoreductase RutF
MEKSTLHALNYQEMLPHALEQLPKGAFLTVKAGEQVNTMTIGWASFGFMWRKPVCSVLVRYSRHTYGLMEKAADFSVSFPLKDNMQKALGIAGSKSGRDIDKFAECGLICEPGIKIASPHIGECGLIYECKIIYKQPVAESAFAPEIIEACYAGGDYHVMYCGEILGTYLK